MKYRLRYLPEAIEDRENIRDYLLKAYEGTAKRFFALLRKKTVWLKDFPYACPVYDDDSDYRRLVVGEFLVFYMVNEDIKSVEIHRIFHGAQRISRQLP